MFTCMPITKVSETLPSTSKLTKEPYFPNTPVLNILNTPVLNILNKLERIQRQNTRNYDTWTVFRGLEIDAEESDEDYNKRRREAEEQ